MYAHALIDQGGYIYADLRDEYSCMMHRETRLPEARIPFRTLAEAKEVFKDAPGNMILAFDESGGVESLWCYEDCQEVIAERLKTWSGCYGAWKVRNLRREAA